CVQLIDTTDREAVTELVKASDYIDAIIPRGGKGLVEAISESAKVPVIKHLHGVCHTYIDKDADTQKAIKIAFNAKTRRYGVCNAMETLLVHASAVSRVLPELIAEYIAKGVELRGCEQTRQLSDQIIAATEEDWDTEYLDAILSIRIVNSMSEAIDHIDQHGSGHTESIVTENYTSGRRFITEVDSSSVMINASTGFADGFEYGLGAEIGISTDKFHVRGPVGLEGLTSQKFIVLGDGHTRA
ncbi:MAG TPA: glutamate-5-semialdehyde dehydrogenase, partial [Gammaproteobacteria bacterium]|nr:glutamate-5-semialdehyde dehydrogenase [Gammaproteobacteria bacterium]